MRTKTNLSPIFILLISAFLYGCIDSNTETITYKANVPVVMSYDEFRTSFAKNDPVEMVQTGKIYFKDNLLFVNEVNKGIHVVDNTNPSDPQQIAFYDIVGNVDIAIRGNTLFADSYIDLLAIDISDVHNPVEIGRLEYVFPNFTCIPGNHDYPTSYPDSIEGVIVDWEVQTVTEDCEVYSQNKIFHYSNSMDMATAEGGSPRGSSDASVGVAGSMARFMLNDFYLYAITHPQQLTTINVATADAMQIIDSVDTWRTMETLFKYKDNLFVGTTTGMMIFDIENAANPTHVSDYDHITACDPVVVDGQYAYVTLRSGNMCFNTQNLLEVIDITNLSQPFLVKSYPMYNPHGLGVDNGLLFICDGAAGLKVFRTDDPLKIVENHVITFPDIDTYDVIPYNDVLMMVAADGIYQYDYSNTNNLLLLSQLSISPN